MTVVLLRRGDVWITMSGEINEHSLGAGAVLAWRELSINSHWDWIEVGTRSFSFFIFLPNKMLRIVLKGIRLRYQVASSI